MYVLFKEMVMCPVTVSHLSFYWRITSFCCVFFFCVASHVSFLYDSPSTLKRPVRFPGTIERPQGVEVAGSWHVEGCWGSSESVRGFCVFFRWSFWIIEVWLCNYVFVLHRNKWIIVSGFWVFDMSKAIGYTFEDMFPILSHHLAIFQTNKQRCVSMYKVNPWNSYTAWDIQEYLVHQEIQIDTFRHIHPHKYTCICIYIYIYIWVFPKIGGTPKWMVYNGKAY